MLEIGAKAPWFALPDQKGTTYLMEGTGIIVQAVGKVTAAENPRRMLEALG